LKRVSFRDVGLKYVLSPYDKPVAHVKPGENLVLEVEDATSGQIRKRGDFRDRGKVPFGNPVVGPIYVEDAEKGSTISVAIKEIKPINRAGSHILLRVQRSIRSWYAHIQVYGGQLST